MALSAIKELKQIASMNESFTDAFDQHPLASHPLFGLKDEKGWLTRYPHTSETPIQMSAYVANLAIQNGVNFDSNGCWGLSPYYDSLEDYSYENLVDIFQLCANALHHPGEWYKLAVLEEYLQADRSGWNPDNFEDIIYLKNLERELLEQFPKGTTLQDLNISFWDLTREFVINYCYNAGVVTVRQVDNEGFHDSIGNYWVFDKADAGYDSYSHEVHRYWDENPLTEYALKCLRKYQARQEWESSEWSRKPQYDYKGRILTNGTWKQLKWWGGKLHVVRCNEAPNQQYVECTHFANYRGKYYVQSKEDNLYYPLSHKAYGPYSLIQTKIGHRQATVKVVYKNGEHMSSYTSSFREIIEKIETKVRRRTGVLCFNDIRNDVAGTYGFCLQGTKAWAEVNMPHLYNLLEDYRTWGQVPEDLMKVQFHLHSPQEMLGHRW